MAAKKKMDANKAAEQEQTAAPAQPQTPTPAAPSQSAAAGGMTPEVMEQLKQLGEPAPGPERPLR